MARCTLDDLVPSTRCNRIFLEPIGTSYSEYVVAVDLSVYDTIDDEEGIADYLFTSEFKDNIKIGTFLCTDDSAENLYNFLKNSRLKPSLQAYVFHQTLGTICAGIDVATFETAVLSSWLAAPLFPLTSQLRNTTFRDNLITLFNQIPPASVQMIDIDFQGYTNSMIENFGTRKFDDDGEIVYDLKISKNDLSFESNITVENCYFYAVTYFDIIALFESRGIPLTPFTGSPMNYDTIDFYFKDIDRCVVLHQNLPGEKVQDFRLTERVEELIRPAFITDYDNTIDQISTITGDPGVKSSDISSELFTAYKENTRTTYYTKNVFYINIGNLLKRNSKYPFLHVNLAALPPSAKAQVPEIELFRDSSVIKSVDIYRVRADDPTDRTLVTQAPLVEPTRFSSIYRYTFSDFGFANISHGKYRYEMEVTIKDPMEDLVEYLALGSRKLSQTLSTALSYIHNNPEGYDEVRDELSIELQASIKSIFNSDTTLSEKNMNFQILFFLFTKKAFANISSSLVGSTTGTLERRKLESFHRVVEDMLFEVGKYYETKDISNASLTSIKNSSIFKYYRKWHNTADTNVREKGVIDVIESSMVGANMTSTGYDIRTTIETQKFFDPTGESSLNIGYLTPNKINDIRIFDMNLQESQGLSELLINTLQKSSISAKERVIMQSMIDNENSYDLQVSELKNNSGIFESFLAEQGTTVINKTAASINTDISIPTDSKISKGIDVGRNDGGSTIATPRSDLIEARAAEAESKRQRAKQQLLNEYTKKEQIISKILIMDEAYSILDRSTFTQGVPQEKRLTMSKYAYYRNIEQSRRSTPVHLDRPGRTITDSLTGEMYVRVFNRVILDNLFMVYYLERFDANMNPVWKHLTDFSMVPNGKVLCKLKRFKSSLMHIGQGTMSDREILSKYFYLTI